jgi:Na+/melibiose symporter-like transporter
MEKDQKVEAEMAAAAAKQRWVIGVGFWVQGFRLFPWLGVNFFLKDGMGVAASSLQILQASANLPMVAKPLLGLLSDAVPIRGGRRLPYVAIGGTPLSPLFTHCLVLQICGHQPTLRSSP